MNPQRSGHADEIARLASALDPQQRADFLEHACAGDEMLAWEVRALLAVQVDAANAIVAQTTHAAEGLAGETGVVDPLGHVDELLADRYRIGARIGEGGMGVVYRAVDERLHRPVAIKFLPRARSGDAERLARFKNEARVLSALNHPHIITIYEVGETGAVPFIAMELVEGQTLRARLQAGPLGVREACDVGIQVARALAAAHDKRIVHRDIKPENVMIRTDGYVKVLDFGVAGLRVPLESDASVLTTAAFETVRDSIVGTPAYMPPEQIEGGLVDARSDVFSLGVVLCESLTGTNPFAGSDLLETVSAIARTPAPAEQVAADLPHPVSAVIVKALQKNPADRYQGASELVAALQEILSGLDARTVVARRSRTPYLIAAAVAIALVTAAGLAYRRVERRQWVRDVAAPTIVSLANASKSATAFPLIATAERYLPDDPDLARAVAAATRVASVRSDPTGAVVEVKDYGFPDEGWLRLGVTPLEKIRVPTGYLRWRVSKPGIGESITAPPDTPANAVMTFNLDRVAHAPAGMVPIAAARWGDYLAFLGWLGPYDLPTFYIDRREVTNREYQEFVDKGGYATPEYWRHPFVKDGHELSWANAMDLFRDTTGRPGPSTWEAGHYPEGKGDYPVSGVSWFEADAYAAFVHKSLPTLAQVLEAVPTPADKFAAPLANLGPTLAPVGQFQSLGVYGTDDLLGNAREWSENAADHDLRYLLGRQPSSYGPEALPAFDRSALNGFRCVQNSAPLPAEVTAPRALLTRDFSHATPAPDAVFHAYRAMYAYDKTPLHATVETVPDATNDWTKQKITFDAPYANERVPAFLFLPNDAKPPFQVVVFFPSARVNSLRSSDALGDLGFVDYVVKSGRAVIYPIYEDLYERQRNAPPNPGPTFGRETLVDWSKDLGRSIDYLETRPDIDTTRVGFLGVSQGAAYGVILATLEDRLKAVVLLDGGFFQMPHPLPGLDQVDFAARLTKPVLMVNGRYDATFPLATAQDPLFRMLGTPSADKRHVVFDTPHDVRQQMGDLVKEVLGWYDKYLGRVH
jgi:dienelactone hydrolase